MEQGQQIDMSKMSKAERKALKRKLREEREQREESQAKREKSMKLAVKASLVVLIVIVLGVIVYVMGSAPGQYDSFAKCMASKGAVIYGNDFCEYTKRQMGGFGKSFGYLSYVKCAENKELCDSKGVTITPTWEINGTMYQGVQTFQDLSRYSGCAL